MVNLVAHGVEDGENPDHELVHDLWSKVLSPNSSGDRREATKSSASVNS